MRRHSVVAVMTLRLLVAGPVTAQVPVVEDLAALAIDSLPGRVTMYYSNTVPAADAAELQQLMVACVRKYESAITGIPPVVVAILDSTTWARALRPPYGMPHQNPASTPVVIFVPATAAAMFPTGLTPGQAQRFFRVLALHELGHQLAFAAVDVDRSTVGGAPPQWPVAGWYIEFAAEYFRISCLPAPDAALGPSDEWLRSNRPAVSDLDEAERMPGRRTADGRPYVGTPEFWANVAWIQLVMAGAARLQYARLGDGFLALLREQWQRPTRSTTAMIVDDLMRSNPDLGQWLRGVGALP
jgi:hypothetical protein